MQKKSLMEIVFHILACLIVVSGLLIALIGSLMDIGQGITLFDSRNITMSIFDILKGLGSFLVIVITGVVVICLYVEYQTRKKLTGKTKLPFNRRNR